MSGDYFRVRFLWRNDYNILRTTNTNQELRVRIFGFLNFDSVRYSRARRVLPTKGVSFAFVINKFLSRSCCYGQRRIRRNRFRCTWENRQCKPTAPRKCLVVCRALPAQLDTWVPNPNFYNLFDITGSMKNRCPKSQCSKASWWHLFANFISFV